MGYGAQLPTELKRHRAKFIYCINTYTFKLTYKGCDVSLCFCFHLERNSSMILNAITVLKTTAYNISGLAPLVAISATAMSQNPYTNDKLCSKW